MIPSLAKAKNDPHLPAVMRVLAWCTDEGRETAPQCGVAARVLHIPRSTAADAIRTLVARGYLRRAA